MKTSLLVLQRYECRQARVGFAETQGRIGTIRRPERVGVNDRPAGVDALQSRDREGAVGDGTGRIEFRSLTVAARKRTDLNVVALDRHPQSNSTPPRLKTCGARRIGFRSLTVAARKRVNRRFVVSGCVILFCGATFATFVAGCSREPSARAASMGGGGAGVGKVGVLLVNHGSRSARWREMLLGVEKGVRADVLALDGVERVVTAFMEYTEPSIATRLEEFDRDGFTDIIIVPLLLTVSSHSFDDIPTICGQQNNVVALERLRADGIRVYKPVAEVHITALLDFPDILINNVLRRSRALSEEASDEGVVLVAYGSADYEAEWSQLLSGRVGAVLKQAMGVPECTHCWCGHLVHYDPAETTRAVEDILKRRRRALVVPVLVAVDEMFQEGVIQDGIDAVAEKHRIRYVPDAILPDAGVRAWVVEAVRDMHRSIVGRTTS